MSDEGPPQGARRVGSLKEYERKLRLSMRLMDGGTRDNVIREIVAGVEEQVRAAGGDFARVSSSLDDPAWVGKQMVKVYGVSTSSKGAILALAAVLAVISVPGVLVSDAALGTVLALVGFASLVLVTYGSVSLVSVKFAIVAASAAAAVRIALFLLPFAGDVAPIDVASSGEVTLFFVATAMLVLVAALPALTSRGRADEA